MIILISVYWNRVAGLAVYQPGHELSIGKSRADNTAKIHLNADCCSLPVKFLRLAVKLGMRLLQIKERYLYCV